MSWKSFESAVDSIFSPRSARAGSAKRFAAFRPGLESLEERLAPASYSTNFDLTELPISEGGAWHHTPNAWTYVTTANGLAYGTNGPANAYDDSYAYLSGFGPNQQAEAVVALPGTRVGAPEVELMLRMADTPTSVRGYEINSNIQIVRWNGAMGDFTVLPTTGPGLGRAMVTGDDFKATMVGNLISVYVNGNLVMQATDSVWTDGQPGIGFFKRPGYTDLAFTSYSATDNLGASAPAVPTGLTAAAGNAQASLTWNSSSGATSYNIYRGTTSGSMSLVQSGVTGTSFTNTGLTNGTTYYYEVTAVNSAGESAKSSQASATPQVALPSAPTGLTAAAGNAQVSLAWNSSSGANSYNVYRGTSGNTSLLQSGVTGTSFSNTGLTNGVTYYYQVTAVNSAGESAKSSQVSATPQTAATFGAHVNFSASTTSVPSGYVNDIGLTYGSRGNGLTFGWNGDMTSAARDRNDPTSPDELHDSLIHVGSSTWEIAVPNGTYTVHVVVGDPSYADVNSKLAVEGVATINGFTSSSQRWLEGTTTVTVSDGRLTIGELAGSYDKIDFIDITSVGGATNQPPTVATAAAASPGTVTGTTTNVSVLGADDGGEANLTYTWAATTVPSGATPTFSASGTNAAKSSSVTFNKAGSYAFQVTIRDAGGLTATSSVNVTVSQTLTSINVSPVSVTLPNGATQQFAASALDQFGNTLSTQPAVTWSLGTGSIGTVSSSGLYTAPASGTGSATVKAASGSVSGTAGVTVSAASGFSAHINFSNNTTQVPAGYVNDIGQIYGPRSGGLTFGWNGDMTSAARDRDDPTAPDELHDSLIHMGTATWEIAVANGTYNVHIVVGDPSWTDVVSKLTAEGLLILSGATSSTQRWLETTALVTVNDGRLTLSNQAGSYNKIDYVDITQVSPEILAGTPLANSHAAILTQKQLDRIVAEAIRDWAATGLSATQISALQRVQFVIADLPGGMLGGQAGNAIYIDQNAAGYGWSLGARVTPHKVDLLTVVSHELGHELGLPDLDSQSNPGSVMDGALAPGVRRLPFDSSGYAADASSLNIRW